MENQTENVHKSLWLLLGMFSGGRGGLYASVCARQGKEGRAWRAWVGRLGDVPKSASVCVLWRALNEARSTDCGEDPVRV